MANMRITVPFAIDAWDEQPAEQGDTNSLATATVRKTFAADELRGSSTAHLVMARTADAPDGAAYSAIELVTGTLAGRSGTFVLVHGATPEDKAASHGKVVTGSGTGELAGLTGTVAFEHDDAGPRLTLDCELPEPSAP
jgi:hypothetical protein